MAPDTDTYETYEADAVERFKQLAPKVAELRDNFEAHTALAEVQPRSSLHADDQASRPVQVSHIISSNLMSAVDHLHAVTTLIVDQGVLHVYAPASLSRSALETAATAYWILHPSKRTERISRGLRWFRKDEEDRVKAERTLGLNSLPVGEDLIRTIAERRSIDPESVRRGPTTTEILKAIDQVRDSEIFFQWQLCSGFAHGRRWATLNALHRVERPSSDPEVASFRLESSPTLAFLPFISALHLVHDSMRIQRQRALVHF